MINKKIFNNAIKLFDQVESRTDFFSLSKKLIDNNFIIEGYLLLLTTWNFASFRYATKTFDIEMFRKTLIKLKPKFSKFQNENFRTINFANYENEICDVYDSLSSIKGIEYTGASKLMHLANPKVFVIWDGYIRGEKTIRYYSELKPKLWERKKYKKDSSGYIEFLQDMQLVYKDIKFKNNNIKTFAKAIDECNYVNITLKIQKMENFEKKEKQKNTK